MVARIYSPFIRRPSNAAPQVLRQVVLRVQGARQDEAIVAQAVEVAAPAGHFRPPQTALGAAADAAADVRSRSRAAAAGQHELGERRQGFVQDRNRRLQAFDARCRQFADHRQVGAEIEELLLNLAQLGGQVVVANLGEQNADLTVELIDVADGGEDGIALRPLAAVGQLAFATVALAGGHPADAVARLGLALVHD